MSNSTPIPMQLSRKGRITEKIKETRNHDRQRKTQMFCLQRVKLMINCKDNTIKLIPKTDNRKELKSLVLDICSRPDKAEERDREIVKKFLAKFPENKRFIVLCFCRMKYCKKKVEFVHKKHS